MGLLKLSRFYRCDNDCTLQGCTGHTATLEFNSISNTYCFDDGHGEKIFLDMESAKAMIQMFKHFSVTRKDSIQF